MSWKDKLASRKLWVTVGSVISLVLAEEFGIDVAPEAIVGLAGIVLSYNFGQGWVDKTVAQEEIRVAGDVGRANAILYARSLEERLEAIGAVDPE